jgi:arginase family enzyme
MSINFIHVPTPFEGGDSFINVKKEYMHTFDTKLYKKTEEDIVPIYSEIYKYYSNLNKDQKYITLSPDPLITCSTIAGLNEQFIYRETDNVFKSDFRVIYFSPLPDILTDDENKDTSDNIVSTLLGLSESPLINNKLILRPEQIIYVGINDELLFDEQKELLEQLNITYFTLEMIKKKGLSNILDYILKQFDKNVYVHIDLKVFSKSTVPSTVLLNDNKNGLGGEDLKTIIDKLKNKISYMDITSFDKTIDSKSGMASKYTIEVCKLLITQLFGIKEKKINIFNDNTKFLIYRPRKQSNEHDIGWYIVRFMDNELKEKILKTIKYDVIQYITIDNEDGEEEEMMLTVTTMEEQNNKSFLTAKCIYDCCLSLQEKMFMGFELINS